MLNAYQSRRDFICCAALAAGACALPRGVWAGPDVLREAMFYDKRSGGMVRCRLCPWRCTIQDGSRGLCGVRENRGGTLYSLVYGRPVAVHNDPIEKKPFVHVYPGSMTYSLATVGCNLRCRFCQNWRIAHARPEQLHVPFVSPEEIARRAKELGSRTIAYTYSEPVIFYEYMYDCAKAGLDLGIESVMISNGFIEEEPMRELLPLLKAVKVDFKSFSDRYYRDVCEGELDPILRTLKTIKSEGTWLELVVLLVPTLNDSDDEIRNMARWVKTELGVETPLNFIRFHPQYRLLNLPPTPQATLQRARDIAAGEGLNFVFATGAESTTRCPQCGKSLVERAMLVTLISYLQDEGRCPHCNYQVPGVW